MPAFRSGACILCRRARKARGLFGQSLLFALCSPILAPSSAASPPAVPLHASCLRMRSRKASATMSALSTSLIAFR